MILFIYVHHLFFHKHTCPHRHLHSFPTRRSSDLRVCTLRTVSSFEKDLEYPRSATSACNRRVERERVKARASVMSRSEEPRLNSSHVEISYAVFCLKKKK